MQLRPLDENVGRVVVLPLEEREGGGAANTAVRSREGELEAATQARGGVAAERAAGEMEPEVVENRRDTACR